jgi:hypothetical protein
MRVSAIVLAALCLVVFGCGESSSDETACELLGEEHVVAALRSAGVDEIVLRRRSTEALDQSICAYRGRGTSVRLNIDSAPEVRRRYFNRVTEALQFSANDPGEQPQAIEGLGDGDAFGPAGAYWSGDFRLLVVLRGERMFIYQVSVRGLGSDSARGAAVALAHATLPGKPRRGERAAGSSRVLDLSLLGPRDGEAIRSGRTVVRGTVAGDHVVVRIGGRPARVRRGLFAETVRLRPGRTRIRVTASSGERVLSRTVTVRRGPSASAVGRAFARRRPGVVPDVLGEPLADARAILTGAGLRNRVVKVGSGSIERSGWAVCRTRPFPGDRARGAEVVLFVDHADPFRASATACAQE